MKTMRKVYVVQHTHIFDNGQLPDLKWLGIYATEQLAQEAISRYRTQEGFRDAPDNFEIEPYVLDQDYWPGGYETSGGEDFEIKPDNGTE